MDIISWATTQVGAFIIGVVLLLFGFSYIKVGLRAQTRKLLKFAGVIAVGYAVLSYAGLWAISAEEAAPVTTVGAYDVTASESMAWLTVDNNAQIVTWAVTYNYTAGDFSGVGGADGGAGAQSQSQYALIQFNVDRGLGTVGLVQTYGEVTSIPSITNDTTGTSYAVLTQSNDQYNALWNRSDGSTAYEMITITIAETADGAIVSLNMTLASNAIGSMDQYDTFNIGVVIGGESWTVQVLLANVS